MAIRVILLDSCAILQCYQRMGEISDGIGAGNESIEKYLNVVILLAHWVGNVDEKVETFLEEGLLVLLLVHQSLEVNEEVLYKCFVFLIVLGENGSEQCRKL